MVKRYDLVGEEIRKWKEATTRLEADLSHHKELNRKYDQLVKDSGALIERVQAENRHLKTKLAESDKAAVLMMARFFSEEDIESIKIHNEKLEKENAHLKACAKHEYSLGQESLAGDLLSKSQQLEVVEKENEELAASLREERIKYIDEAKIVSRIWGILGNPTFEELKGRSIYDLIAGLKAENEELRRDAEKVKELEAALIKIKNLDPEVDTDEGFNEWGEACCFKLAQDIADAAMPKKTGEPE